MSNSANSLYQSNGMISAYMPDNGITAKSQMAFQEYLSNTSHQREMADLKAAGLNPWLASNSGASTPTGGQDSGDVISMLNGNSGKRVLGSVQGQGFLYNLFTAFGMHPNKAKGLSQSLHDLGLSDEAALEYGLKLIGLVIPSDEVKEEPFVDLTGKRVFVKAGSFRSGDGYSGSAGSYGNPSAWSRFKSVFK